MKFIVIIVICASLVSGLDIDDDCITPYNKPGKCVSLRNCDYIQEILRKNVSTYEDVQYVEKSNCGYQPGSSHIPRTCCPALLNPKECGVADGPNGILTKSIKIPDEHPWVALLIYDTNGNNSLVPKCGGSLLNSRYVLTAAHCIVDIPKRWKLQYVRFSEWNPISKENCTMVDENEEICRQEYTVEKIIVHPQYSKTVKTKVHDITLLKLEKDVEFSKYVKPICLPFDKNIRNLPIDDEDFTVTVWGLNEPLVRKGNQRLVDLVGQSLDECNEKISIANITLAETQMCVGGQKGKDSCKGDLGGPLMRQVGIVWYQVGVVNLGNKYCGSDGLPGIYTNVVKYLKWIEQEVNKSH